MDSTGSLDEIARKTAETSSFKEVVNRLTSGEKQVPLQGLPDSLLSFLLTHVQRSIRKPMLVVASDEDTAERWRDDLQAVAGENIVKYFPAWDIDMFESRSPDPEITELRIVTATSLLDREPTIVVAPIEALVTPLIPAHALDLGTVRLRVETEHSLEDLTAHLADCGFECVAMIDAIGQYSVRGGIIDIYHQKQADSSDQIMREHLAKIGDTLIEVYQRAEAENAPTNLVANRIAEERFAKRG